jgi:NADH:ubiquinone oxidoreductase subunit H
MSETGLIACLLSILFLLFIALTERKVFAYVMRRVGPVLMGRNGAFQIVADLVKFLSKEVFFIPRPTTALAPIFLALM